MHLLAIDTATRRVGVAIGCESGLLGAVELGGGEAPGPPRHAEQLAPAIEYLCAETGVTVGQLSAVAVGTGPGMFTGLRVGVTTAKVLAQALRIPVIPIPSLDLIAYPLRHASVLVVPVLDARRHEVYYALYRPVPGGLQRISGYELGTPDDVAGELQSRGEEAIVAGDGATRFRDAFTDLDRVELARVLASQEARRPRVDGLREAAADAGRREGCVALVKLHAPSRRADPRHATRHLAPGGVRWRRRRGR